MCTAVVHDWPLALARANIPGSRKASQDGPAQGAVLIVKAGKMELSTDTVDTACVKRR